MPPAALNFMRALAVLALLASFPVHSQDSSREGKKVFNELKALVGDWKSRNPGSTTTVNYRVIANGSSLVETWTMSPTRQSMTVYTLDGDELIATHYCPQGNAPRLKLASRDASGKSQFIFMDGANLQDALGSHEHAFWVRIDAADVVSRSETYIGNTEKYDPSVQGQAESFQRLR